ncbi:translation elongation factor Ts [Deferribacter desulfuricans SSM1]|uniref:Elongation factor Ts n=1 Tax=Deferribacter desulfuricans (strain DSM 14783 / JCM 11476 / NBRC 101012 / SSM1) TaxID=639282 RepID=D3PAD9_DEFDS|nr:translation elongation factor Ts [Deferribacter desulfuricans]BAI79562.1 translation elongation factor Ts [Deferribacter desulfuricans SSM1]
MAQITAALVKELREKTGAGMMDCKKALQETDGNIEKAIEYLRKKGLADAAKKAGRVAAEGLVASYIHGGGKIGVLVEINCETDFVARTDEFKELCHDIAMHICASNPLYVSKEEVPQEVIDKEKEIYIAKAKEQGKPDHIIEKIVEGQVRKYLESICLLDQPFVKNPDLTVSQYIAEKIAKIGENIKVRRFVRYQLGEGIEKKQENFVEEVMKQAKGN